MKAYVVFGLGFSTGFVVDSKLESFLVQEEEVEAEFEEKPREWEQTSEGNSPGQFVNGSDGTSTLLFYRYYLSNLCTQND